MMKKYLLLLLPLFLTLTCFAGDADRADLYTVRETIAITPPDDGLGDWDYYEDGEFIGANMYIKGLERDSDLDNVNYRYEDIYMVSQYLFDCNQFKTSDLLPMFLKNDAIDEKSDLVLVEELPNGVIVRYFEVEEYTNWHGELVTEKEVHLVRLILSDSAYHTIDYSRYDSDGVVKWSDEDQELWANCLRNAQIVPIS